MGTQKHVRLAAALGYGALLCCFEAVVGVAVSFAQLSSGALNCPGLTPFENSPSDASGALQQCIDAVEPGGRLELKPGVIYTIERPIKIIKPIVIATSGMGEGGESCGTGRTSHCASFFRGPGFQGEKGGDASMFDASGEGVSFNHIVLNGMQSLASNAAKSCSKGGCLTLKSAQTALSRGCRFARTRAALR